MIPLGISCCCYAEETSQRCEFNKVFFQLNSKIGTLSLSAKKNNLSIFLTPAAVIGVGAFLSMLSKMANLWICYSTTK